MNRTIFFRVADSSDIPALAAIRAAEWGDEDYWIARIGGYLEGTLSPCGALPERICYLAADGLEVVGFAAGHLTIRHGCQGEVQWLNVPPDHRRTALASRLLVVMAG